MKKAKKTFTAFLITVACFIALVLVPSFYVRNSTEKNILNNTNYDTLSDFDCVIVLGAGVRDGKPTPMLRDRLLTAVSLYEMGAAPKLIMSGDHGQEDYDEVNIMKSFAIEKNVPDTDIFMDHAGFSTYDTIYRAKEIFGANKIIIVTQKYHLYRALYIAHKLKLDAVGVTADLDVYAGQWEREMREILARDKDFFKCIFKPKSTLLGEKISISGDGNQTND